jgi:hypothetical protein
MKNQFDELAKGMAQSVTRRQALKKFGVGLAAMALGCFGLANLAQAKGGRKNCLGYGASCTPGPGGTHCCKGLICRQLSADSQGFGCFFDYNYGGNPGHGGR